MPTFIDGQAILAMFTRITRTAEATGQRLFQLRPGDGSDVLVDNNGRLLTRAVGDGGYDTPDTLFFATVQTFVGSGFAQDDLGLVESHLVQPSANNIPLADPDRGNPGVTRFFGYVAAPGWVQIFARDESGGANPPVLNSRPDISIAVPVANTNFFFGNWSVIALAAGNFVAPVRDIALYVGFSTTGPTFTPGGPNLWFTWLGYI